MSSLNHTELLATINTNVDNCNRLSDLRLNQCRALSEASVDSVREYLTTRRMTMFRNSAAIQKTFNKLFIRLR